MENAFKLGPSPVKTAQDIKVLSKCISLELPVSKNSSPDMNTNSRKVTGRRPPFCKKDISFCHMGRPRPQVMGVAGLLRVGALLFPTELEMAAPNLNAEKEADSKLNLFEACKNGDLERVDSLLSPESVNSRDVAGRKSTPIHFAAGNY